MFLKNSSALLLVLFLVPQTFASVTQVDGSIVPAGNALQGFLNTEEGFSPPDAQSIDAIRDAETIPEIFLPDTSKIVTFKDIAEGAGFENSFGYYNVGDDITDVNNLHPIFGCGISAATHSSEAAGYVQNAEPGDIASIDFGVEFSAGRYQGGFIGFYLIAPEDNPSNNNCGDFVNGSDGLSLFGKIYFTERDLNNDGDFVHSLVYQSNRLDQPDRFYFGFEDLFRGGDNDFEDMAIQVNGLTPPCIPVAETCNNKDDDCDGIIDNDPVDVGEECAEGIGACQNSGVTICENGNEICNAAPGDPIQEICNDIDDDCDGVIDNDPSDVGNNCSAGLGECFSQGSTICQGGFEVCNAQAGTPIAETCNDLDDDCDGLIDEDFGVGNACDGVGECGQGFLECASSSTTRCSTDPLGSQDQSQNESCDALDNDCDGATDENADDVGLSCTVGVGTCQRTGSTICADGNAVCNVSPGAPQGELCNGVDDDCDGLIDEDFGVGNACDGVGECGQGFLECASSSTTRCSTDPLGSQDQSQNESCDALDNDCDGVTDEGLNNLGSCGLSDVGECVDGLLACVSGEIECVGEIGPTAEFCDGLDNDCDGVPDNETVDEGEVCGTDTGECELGQSFCSGGSLVCFTNSGPEDELCDGLDNDCDGISDNNLNDPEINQSCGLDTGECEPGLSVCLSGQIQCLGETGPQTELCDGLDNDCDGVLDNETIDTGQPCGSNFGVCSPGVSICENGVPICDGAFDPGLEETCNGVDDDCDGIIDDAPVDAGNTCGLAEGECQAGTEACVAGNLICQGEAGPTQEICDGIDNDCDGFSDEEPAPGETPLCEEPTQCIEGACRLGCSLKSPQCAGGEICSDADNDGIGFCVPNPCLQSDCDAPFVCDFADGECRLGCEIFPCDDDEFCDATDGFCKEDNCYGFGCPTGEICLDAVCVEDLCQDVLCQVDEFCREGECVPSCEGVLCLPQEECIDGECVEDLCFDQACESIEQCVPETGECSKECLGIRCGDARVCDPQTGLCVDDACTGIVCTETAFCENGQCVSPANAGFITSGGAGCSVHPETQNTWIVLLFFFGLLVLRFRKKALLLIFLLFSACILDPFFLVGGQACEQSNDGIEACDGIDNDCNGEIDEDCVGCVQSNNGFELCDNIDNDCNGIVDDDCQGAACFQTNNGVELCDNIDNDCDGIVDDGFDLNGDTANCGDCGNVCSFTGAFSDCVNGQCIFEGCAPGNIDLNGNPNDGCEYACIVTNGGTEICDNKDNDCDGDIDEDIDFDTDVNNCGFCGNTCVFFQASPSCIQGACTFDPETDCQTFVDPNTNEETQFHEVDGDPNTGCEYACNPEPADPDPSLAETACDSIDNDCDGIRDDGFDFDTDPQNCGGCGRVCSFPNVASPFCIAGLCQFDSLVDCDPGTHDIDGNSINGCEYACTPTNTGIEICDGLDNDCDGFVDELLEVETNDPAIGQDCGASNIGECQSGSTICIAGAPRCEGAKGPRAETCDGLDNDCDGESDEIDELIDIGQVCAPPQGECSFGLTVCDVSGILLCERQEGPSEEICDGLDNDCDGVIDGTDTDGDGISDQEPVDVAQGCGGGPINGGESQCVEGVSFCDQGILLCAGAVDPSLEICDGLDNDCNGTVDDNPSQVGQACGSNIGECQQGTFACTTGELICEGEIVADAEICDGLDNDCSGLPDDNLDAANDPRIGLPCGSTDVGACEFGSQICSGGSIFCAGQIEPLAESCDLSDNDCDGNTDEDESGQTLSQICYDGPSGTQGIGECRGGTQVCTDGEFQSACIGQILPQTEICDGLDNDCDGTVDEADAGGPLTEVCYDGPLGTEDSGICQTGVSTCSNGFFGACIGQQLPEVEICSDSLDNDCDDTLEEGCFLAQGQNDIRIDAFTGAGSSSDEGEHHSFEVDITSSGSTVFAVFADNRINDSPRIFLARSLDGGQSFLSSLTQVSEANNLVTTPKVLAIGDVVFVAFAQLRTNQTRDLMVAVSIDGGNSFATPQRMDANNNTLDAFHYDMAVTQSGNTLKLAIVWEELNTSNGNLPRSIKVRRSLNAGVATPVFDGEQVANRGAGNPIAGRPKVIFGDADRIVLVWREQRLGGNGTTDIFSNFWEDSSPIIEALDQRIDVDPVDGAPDDLPVLARIGSEIYVAWEDIRADGADISFTRSIDNGNSFETEQIIDDPDGELSTSLNPSISAIKIGNENRVYLAWEDDRDGTEVFVARSLDGGALFEEGVRASSLINPIPGVSLQPQIATNAQGEVAVTFSSTRNGLEDVFLSFSLDGGTLWQPVDIRLDTDEAGLGDSNLPKLTPLLNGFGVVWIDFRTNGVNGDIFFREVTP